MKKALEVAKDIAREYSQNTEKQTYMPITCKSIGSCEEVKFEVKQRLGEVIVDASNPLAAVNAISQLATALSSDTFPRCLGKTEPLFSLRPLWIDCDEHVSISEKVGIHLPSFFLNMKRKIFDSFCRRVIELGYNCVILGTRNFSFMDKSPKVFKEFPTLLGYFSEYGISVIAKPNFYFYKEDELVFSVFCEQLQDKINGALQDFVKAALGVKAIFWRSLYDHFDFQFHPMGRNKTKEDKALFELKILEKFLPPPVQLIYYLPCEDNEMANDQCAWLNNLINNSFGNTIFSFSAVAADPSRDFARGHPFWEKLEATRKASATLLMPVVNTGGVGHGEGLWPSFPLDIFRKYIPVDSHHNFAGVIQLAPRIPRKGSLLDCSYWIASQMMWRRGNPEVLFKAWFRANRPTIDIEKYFPLFMRTREIVKELGVMCVALKGLKNKNQKSSQEVRLCGERMFAEFKEMDYLISEWHTSSYNSISSIKDYYTIFLRDARKILTQYLHYNDVSVSQTLSGDCKGDGFWTETDKCQGEGAMFVSKTNLRDVPKVGEQGSLSHKIYWESTIKDLV